METLRAEVAAEKLEITVKKALLDLEEQQTRLTHDKERHAARMKRDQESHDDIWKLRRKLASWGLGIVVVWQLAVFGIMALVGAERMKIPDGVMIALLSTTTANVIGLLVIVMKFVFPSPGGTERPPRIPKPRRNGGDN